MIINLFLIRTRIKCKKKRRENSFESFLFLLPSEPPQHSGLSSSSRCPEDEDSEDDDSDNQEAVHSDAENDDDDEANETVWRRLSLQLA